MSKSCEGQAFSVCWPTIEALLPSLQELRYLLLMLVEHILLFLLMDHLSSALRHAFPDSKIAKEVNFARTCNTAVVKHALVLSHMQ